MTCSTPRFVLHEDRAPIGPEISPASTGHRVLAIYGFSGKAAYDAFIGNSEGDLRPYPLMKGYLKKRLEEDQDGPSLVIIDAVSRGDVRVVAATMGNVLAAQDNADTELDDDVGLTLNATGTAYSLE